MNNLSSSHAQGFRQRLLILITFITTIAMPVGVFAQEQVSVDQGPVEQSQVKQSQVSSAPEARNFVFMPVVMGSSSGVGAADLCGFTAQRRELFNLLISDPDQKRASPTCNATLARVAQARAEDMAQRGYFAHTNPDGIGPNHLVEAAGYVLPTFYSHDLNGNNIESIAGGTQTASATWRAWKSSSGHRPHVLGEDPFYAEQVDIGIGYVYIANSTYKHYWVIITAKPGP